MVALAAFVLLGLEGSYNFGEEPPGAIAQAVIEYSLGDARAFGSTMDKSESHEGYALGVDTDFHPRIGPLVGFGWRYRDGGPWTKHTTWLRGGWAVNEYAAVLAWDLTSENEVRLVELRGRWPYLGFCLEQRFGLARYNNTEQGGYVSLSVGKEF